jgi:hypothetical protein
MFRIMLTIAILCALTMTGAARQASVTTDVVYGHKDGLALTFDVYPSGTPQRRWRHLDSERRLAIERGFGLIFAQNSPLNEKGSPYSP